MTRPAGAGTFRPMSAEDEDDGAERKEKKGYNFILRFIIFAFIAGPASVFGFGVYGRMGVTNALNAADRGDYFPVAILTLWVAGLISTAFMVFKR